MDCDLLTNSIGACSDKTFKGYNRIGWWALYDSIDQSSISITDNVVSFNPIGQFYEIYDGSDKPFDGTKVTFEKSSKHGYNLSNHTVMFPLRANTVENAILAGSLAQGKRIVVVLDQRGVSSDTDGKYPIYGISGGLRLKTPIQDWTSDVAWDLEFEDKNTKDTLLFVDALTSSWIKDYEVITGLSIASGGAQCGFEINYAKTGYLIKPSGTILTSDNGVINNQNNDAAGECILIVPKNTTLFAIGSGSVLASSAEYTGILTTQLTSEIDVSGCLGLTGLICPNSLIISANDCNFDSDACTALVVALDEAGNENGELHLEGGTNAPIETWTVDGNDAAVSLTAKGWTITTNQA